MFEGKIEAGTLQTALEAVGALVDECKMRFTPSHLSITVREPGNVTSIGLKLDSEAFDTFEAREGQVGVDITGLREIIRGLDSDAVVHLKAERREFRIQTANLDYSLRLIDASVIGDRQEINEESLPARVMLERTHFDELLRTTGLVADTTSLGVDESERVFYAAAEGEYESVRIEFDEDDLLDLEPASARSLFSIQYLKTVNGGIPDDADVTLRLGEEAPAVIRFQFSDGDGTVTYNVAPSCEL